MYQAEIAVIVVFWVCSGNASSAGAYSGYREGVEYGALLRENIGRISCWFLDFHDCGIGGTLF